MSAAIQTDEHYPWWASLKHGGLLIAPARLRQFFPETAPPLRRSASDRLRREITRLRSGDSPRISDLLDVVLEEVLGLPKAGWLQGNALDRTWSQKAITGETVRPRRVWQSPQGAALPVFVQDAASIGRERDGSAPRLGVGRGRRTVSRVVEWLRRANREVALLTNGRQWRLIHAGPDYDAWCEWDIDLWFEEGAPGLQVEALRILLSESALTATMPDEAPPLLAAIRASRQGQAELSAVLGERVRQAVELLIRECSPAIDALPEPVPSNRDIYIAATRMVMRCVVALFSEARDLLPRDNPIYHHSYGIQGLREQLDRFSGGRAGERLRNSHSAWPRLLALFRLIYEGSPHEALPILRYGGGLFAPGDPNSEDPIRRALCAFEDAERAPSDEVVHRLLELLCRSMLKVRQGRSSAWFPTPVDFSDLSSEYIGILYEGLLDFELRRAAPDDPMIFLNLGDQPALPLTRLEAMGDSEIERLVEKAKKASQLKVEGAEEGEEEQDSEDAEAEEAEGEDAETEDAEDETPAPDATEEEAGDEVLRLRERARVWAKRAATAGKLVPKPRSGKPEALSAYETAVEETAKQLVNQVVLPGEWFLVRWGGTRKGAGTFYTPPGLAVPTVQRTLRPLAYDPPTGADGQPDDMAPGALWTPKPPEAILGLKVCDPACGSGSFLVASLRFLTDALWESLFHHGWLAEKGGGIAVALPADARPKWFAECVHDLPVTAEAPSETAAELDLRLRSRLKRHVVERCIYGVDLDPLAVELARLALWVETMDRSLAFSFLDHKIKCGNSLVGCWFDRFRDYPALAWAREAGDKEETKPINRMRTDEVKPKLHAWVERLVGQQTLPFAKVADQAPEAHHDLAAERLASIHSLGNSIDDIDRRARLYAEHFADPNGPLARLKEAFDCWCAIWFWPVDELDAALLPDSFENPSAKTRAIVRRLREEYRFFHWELEFPDVFVAQESGFDAVVGNPPWEIQKPKSQEFFSNIDPLYRGYGKQEALRKQKEYFRQDPVTERAWLSYKAHFKALSNWNKHVGAPFGDGDKPDDRFNLGKGSAGLHEDWRKRRARYRGYSDATHPFCYQGTADINTYKMFLEQAHALLRDGGQLGMIVPSGICTDKGASSLRRLYLDRCSWRWLFGFENREGIFDIHRSFKFCALLVGKGGRTNAIQTAFMRRELQDWEQAELHAVPYPRKRAAQFSPHSYAILEIRGKRDLDLITRIYENAVLLGDQGPAGWGIGYRREFDMTSDSALFPPCAEWEAKGYEPDDYGRWLAPDGRMAVPLYQGGMIGQFDFSVAGYGGGSGHSVRWDPIPWSAKRVVPQYLMSVETAQSRGITARASRIAYRYIANPTNQRTMYAALVAPYPCGHTIGVLSGDELRASVLLPLVAVLNSYAFDWVLRLRFGGSGGVGALDPSKLFEVAVPRREGRYSRLLASLATRLNAASPIMACIWLELRSALPQGQTWRQLWAVTPHERLRLRCILDAVIAAIYGLDEDEFAWILRDCDYPLANLADKAFRRTLDPKGFWRVDKEKEPELRHTVLTQIAFHDLQQAIAGCGGDREAGIEAFLAQNGGEGWMLPETLRLADYGLGHDERARQAQPVRAVLGDRFLPWQLEQGVEESWSECERHARNLLGDQEYARLCQEIGLPVPPELLDQIPEEESSEPEPVAMSTGSADGNRGLFVGPAAHALSDNPVQLELFPNPIAPKGKRRR